jgi:hypothetical protein
VKRTIRILSCTAAAFVIVSIGAGSKHRAQVSTVLQAKESDVCSTKAAKGNYALSLAGNLTGLGDAAGIGVMTLDDDGHVTGNAVGKVAGALVTTSMTGSFAVKSDCTATFTLFFPGAFAGVTLGGAAVIFNDGKDADVLITSSSPVAAQFTGSAHRQLSDDN